MVEKRTIRFTLNGEAMEVTVKPYLTLLQLLREHLDHTEVKEGCSKGDCGACTVLLNGRAVNSCLVLAMQADGKEILTSQGLGTPEDLHPLQEAFMDYGAIQCGYCTPGMIMSAKALLDENLRPTRQEIKEAISGNICRCTGYEQIIEAVEAAAQMLREEVG
jgi:carbon-monoxide dehydrogenase small subunit